MSDIFISYSSKDRPWVERFAKTLETYGWSVWWDRNIPTGGSFNAVIRQELGAAKCAIVVWSERSVESEWVQAEAAEAKQQDKYLPVKINESDIPLGFTQRTFQSLVDWEAGVDHAGFSQLLKDIERLVKRPPKHIAVGPKPWWKQIPPIWLVSFPAILAAAVVIGLMLWPVPARVQVELTTERVEFEIGAASQGKPTLGGFDVQSIAIEKFSSLSFEPTTVEVADTQYLIETDDFPPSAWKPLNVDNAKLTKVTLDAKDQTLHPKVTVEGLVAGGSETIHLDPMAVARGTWVIVEAREIHGGKNEGFTLQVTGQETITLSIHKPFELIADHTELRNIALPVRQQDEMTYRVTLPEQASWIEITALPSGLVLSPTFASGQSAISFFSGIPVVTMDFTKQDSSGERVSALTGQGTISFPDYPHLGSVPLNEGEAIGLERLDKFTIERVTLRPDGKGMNVVGHGLVKQVRTKRGEIPIQHNLTALDALWHNARLAVFLTIIVTVFTTSLGAYRLWKEFKR
ncbi:MAG: toll/interleukin-1 receptor domain-containing protein [Nitrospira sp. LK70]|nr:toll/interleukin-1 receptor domain-containing protein [Nitrospira sp. LK70]